MKLGAIKAHFPDDRNDAVRDRKISNIFAQSPIDPAKFTAIIPPVDGRCATAPVLPAPVAELVDAADSKSVSPSEWEFDSPRGHHRTFPSFQRFYNHAKRSHSVNSKSLIPEMAFGMTQNL